MKQLSTRWGASLDVEAVLQEYPRPQLVRDSYMNLNGLWDFELNKSQEVEAYTQKIVVPFSPESYLSGLGIKVNSNDVMHYRREFSLDNDFLKSYGIIHFGAVDQECTVFLNGIEIGTHSGGYLPFSFEVPKASFKPINTLEVCAIDKTEQSPHARGKQKVSKTGKMRSLFYTANSGIWQTVWIESVDKNYIQSLKITPDIDQDCVAIYVKSKKQGIANLTILDGGTIVKSLRIETNCMSSVSLTDYNLWTPKNPHCYEIKITLDNDVVESYFGMRKFSRSLDTNGMQRFMLNNKPYFFSGVLDQGYWPESLMSAPSDAALKYDIEVLKSLGFNTIRKHVKIESARFYAHCDRIGMAVWQDMPNGGGDYNMNFVTYLPNVVTWSARHINDHHYRIFRRDDQKGREQFNTDLDTMVDTLYNYPSIAAWVPFNEGWGQFDARSATERILKLDNTRLINEACGWFDQGGGDMYSIHNYFRKLVVRPQSDRVIALTEYGGYAYAVEDHTAFDTKFGYRHLNSAQDLNATYEKVWNRDVLENVKRGLSAAIFTQVSDIEEEVNGIMTYDRKILKIDKQLCLKLNTEMEKLFEDRVLMK